MARRKQSRGNCVFCGKEMTRGGLARHLPACAKRQEATRAADAQKKGKTQPVFQLQVQDAWGGFFWLHLEITGTAKMRDLDNYLRAIWLECCGHLSEFSIGGAWSGHTVAMSAPAARVLSPGVELTHVYDFGTTSETRIKVVGVRQGKPLTRHPLYLMARNHPPQETCMECDQPAEWLCMECVYEHELSGFLCNKHADEHPHDDYGEPLPFVNSPRVGMCGYSGPAEPPY